jgi:hypothetical protein
MMTISKKQDIAIHLKNVIKRIRHNRNIIERIKSNVFKHGIMRGEMQRMINGEVDFEKLDNDVLCVIVYEIHNITATSSIDPKLYFTTREMDNALQKNFLKKEESIFPISLQFVNMDSDTYKTYVPINFLVKLYNNNIFQYNNIISSNYKLINRGERITKVINFDTEKVFELSNELINKKREPNRIILNVLSDNEETITYNERYLHLLIKESKIEIVDGLYELAAFSLVCEQKPNNKLNTELVITNYNQSDLKHFIKHLKIQTGGVN